MKTKRKTTPKKPRGPRNLKAAGFTDGTWRREERRKAAVKQRDSREMLPVVDYPDPEDNYSDRAEWKARR